MNPTDHWDDLKSAGAVPPPSPEVLAHANRQLRSAAARRRIVRRVLAPVVAAAGTAAAVVGAVAVYQTTSGPMVAGPGPITRPVTTPTAPSGKPSQGIAASCVVGYSPAELQKRGFAFDGTVLKVVEDPGGAMPSYLLTFQVHEWFKPTDGALRLTVRTYNPPEGSSNWVSSDFPGYTVGTRLLIAGEPQWGGTNPLKDAFAWGCGFSRAYSADDAATWRKILSK
jgi:hypothetical protein